ncbi:MAG: hypothetical protein ACRDXB_23425, partial [Actinomycetes bacterium]
MQSPEKDRADDLTFSSDLPAGWTVAAPRETDAEELTALLRRHEKGGRGWPASGEDDVLVEVSAEGQAVRQNIVLRDRNDVIRG